MIPWAKQNIMLHVWSFKKGAVDILIYLYRFSVRQLFKISISGLILLRKQEMPSFETT